MSFIQPVALTVAAAKLAAFRRYLSIIALPALVLLVFVRTAPARAGEVLLQYYESRWETIERRLPDIFTAGYSSLWLPPPGKADTGGYSVGYDVFDRFNLGRPFDQTLYGTESSARQLVDKSHDAGLKVYFDYVMNHNGFRDASTPGFVASGDYPGFVVTLPNDVDGDFHSAFASGEIYSRLSGLIDIAQEKNHVFVRQPADDGPQNIPGEMPRSENSRFYPDLSLPPNSVGIHPFNLASPMNGDPTPENATGLLLRNAQWLVEVIGADGMRMDAVKHVPPFFFSEYFDNVMFQRGRTDLAGNNTTPFTFGEALTGDFSVLGQYRRRDSFANRDVLDFPLFFTLRDVLSASGYGDMRRLEQGSVDSIDGNANDGSAGVMFAQSHDDYGPTLENVAYAHILTRTGLPIVYHNALEFGGGRAFPKRGRDDALTTGAGEVIPRLVDVGRRYGKGAHRTRSINEDVYVYERSNSLLVGLNDRGDDGYDERTIPTDFRNVVLTELSGTAADPIVNRNGDILSTISVDGSGFATIRIPRNSTNGTTHNKGYVMYGLAPPDHTHTISPVATILPPDPATIPAASRRTTPLHVITGTTFSVAVQTAAGINEDNALIKLDGGVDVDSIAGISLTTGEFAGFEQFTDYSSPRATGGTGAYDLTIDTDGLSEGLHFLETVTFLPRPSDSPTVYSSVRSAVYLDRTAPPVSLVQPTATGSNDVQSQSISVIAHSADMTAESMHVFFDQTADFDFLTNANDSNRMTRFDRGEFRFDWNNITEGNHSITIVAFEPTGNSSVTRFDNIVAALPEPPMALGIDTNTASDAVMFQPMPSTIIHRAYANEFVIRVDRTGGLSFPSDYSVSLEIDGQLYEAQTYSESLLPPENRLVQHDQNTADEFEEFRFLWRGYSHGFHSFLARAELTTGAKPANSVSAIVTVHEGVPGPPITITEPVNGSTLSSPDVISVTANTDATAQNVQVFLSQPNNGSPFQLLDSIDDPGTTPISIQSAVGSYLASDEFTGINLFNGDYTIKAVASTGPGGTGIASEAVTTFTVTGFPAAPPVSLPVIDGNISEFFNRAPLEVSAADGVGWSSAVADFGADGSLTELHARIFENTLYLAVRGDMFNGSNPNANATIVYIDVDAGSGTGAKSFHTTSDLTDSATSLRHLVRNSGFVLNSVLVGQGIGFDAAAIIDSTDPLAAKMFGLGSGGVAGTPSSFAELPGTLLFGRGFQSFPPAPGAAISGPSGIELAIPLAHLANADPLNMAFVVVTTSETSFPSPNTLPENAQNSFDAVQVLDGVARFLQAPQILINEVSNGEPDYVELLNTTSADVPLDEWHLRWTDSNGTSAHLLLTGGTAHASDVFVLCHNGSLSPLPPVGSVALEHNIPWHPDRAGSAALLDPYGIAVDYVRWVSTAGHETMDAVPVGTDFSGYASGFDGNYDRTIGRDSASSDTDSAADWQVMTPTPGAANPITATVADWMLHQ